MDVLAHERGAPAVDAACRSASSAPTPRRSRTSLELLDIALTAGPGSWSSKFRSPPARLLPARRSRLGTRRAGTPGRLTRGSTTARSTKVAFHAKFPALQWECSTALIDIRAVMIDTGLARWQPRGVLAKGRHGMEALTRAIAGAGSFRCSTADTSDVGHRHAERCPAVGSDFVRASLFSAGVLARGSSVRTGMASTPACPGEHASACDPASPGARSRRAPAPARERPTPTR